MEEQTKTKVRKLSHGMKKRLGFAQALLGNPKFIILDEPTSGLDPKVGLKIKELIKQVGKTKTVLISSHNLSEIKELCSEICVIHKGELVVQDKTNKILKSKPDESFISLLNE